MKRVAHEFVQTNFAPPAKVFPLLCPVRESDWVPGWKYRLIFSESGFAELGCVFATPNPDATETIWTVTHYDQRAFEIHFAWVYPGHVATRLEIHLAPAEGERTEARVRYVYTALSEDGESELVTYTPAWFAEKMEGWEASINHYLVHGECPPLH